MQTAIHLSNGMIFNLDAPDYNAEDFASNLNKNNLQMLTVGNISLNKTAINYIVPKETPENANVRIYLNNATGSIIDTYIEEFKAEDISFSGNNPMFNVMAIGDVVINKHMVMMVAPIEQTA